MDKGAAEKHKGELVSAWVLAELGDGARTGMIGGLVLMVMAVALGAQPKANADSLNLMNMSLFVAATTGIGGTLGALNGLRLGARRKIEIIEEVMRRKPEDTPLP